MLHQKIKLFFYFTDRRISFLLTFTCRSKTDRTMKIAALCNFQNHTAAFSFMFLAEPAVIRTGLFFTLWIYRSLSRQIFSSPGEVICYTSLPDQCPEFPMKITFIAHSAFLVEWDSSPIHFLAGSTFIHTGQTLFVLPIIIKLQLSPVLSVFP